MFNVKKLFKTNPKIINQTKTNVPNIFHLEQGLGKVRCTQLCPYLRVRKLFPSTSSAQCIIHKIVYDIFEIIPQPVVLFTRDLPKSLQKTRPSTERKWLPIRRRRDHCQGENGYHCDPNPLRIFIAKLDPDMLLCVP